MSSRFLPIFAGVAMAATASAAFAFDAMVTSPTALRAHASHRAAVIEVIPANAVIDMAHCYRGWCEAAYAGQMGYVYTPVLVSGEPVSPADEGPIELLTAPATVVGGVFGAVAPVSAPVVARY